MSADQTLPPSAPTRGCFGGWDWAGGVGSNAVEFIESLSSALSLSKHRRG